MNQVCRVCGEPAAGYHFGAFTCEGCKSFFGRTYNNLGSMPECKNKGECEINKRNRTACKCCRYRKCLKVGMSKESSRYGRRSNWFKTHCAITSNQDMLAMEIHGNSSSSGLNFHPSQNSSMNDRNVVANEMPGTSSSALNFHPLQAHLYNWCFRNNAAVQSQLPIVSLPRTPREIASLPFDNLQRQQSPATATSTTFLQADMRVPFYSLPSTESGTLNPDTDEDYSDVDCNSRSNNTPSSSASSMTNEQERSKPEVSINGTVMLATNNRPQLNHFFYTHSPVMTTMAAHPARCRDQLPVSPNPGVIADEQNQPIDLSIRTSGRSSQIKAQNKKEECEADENPIRPLDLTLAAYVP